MRRRNHRADLLAAALLLASPGLGEAASGARSGAADTTIVRVGSGDSATDAFVAWPGVRKNAPAVVVVHEGWGLNMQIRDVARRLARDGYVAIVPDLYHGPVPEDEEQAEALMQGLEEGPALADLEAAMKWLRAQPDLAKSRIGIVGFSKGGRLAQLLAIRGPGLSAAVMFYGLPVTDPKALAGLKTPLQAHFGATDAAIPSRRVDELRLGLRKIGREGDVYVYAGAGQAFMNEQRPSYHPDAARQAWARTMAFLQKYLKG